MKYIDISTLPRVKFAHKHSADTYDFSLSSKINGIEVCYVSEGSLTLKKNDETFTAEKGDIICLVHDSDIIISITINTSLSERILSAAFDKSITRKRKNHKDDR